MACRARRQESRLVPSFPLAAVPLLSKSGDGRFTSSAERSTVEGLVSPHDHPSVGSVSRNLASQGTSLPPQQRQPHLLHIHNSGNNDSSARLDGDLPDGDLDDADDQREAFSELECDIDPTISGPTEIVTGLYLGCHGDALQGPSLQARNITRILNVAAECEDDEAMRHYGVQEVRKIALQDHSDELISAVWDESCAWIHDTLLDKKKGGVLVHCKMGVSRSASIVVAYLMKYGSPSNPGHWSYRRSFEWVKSRRPQISPNLGFTLSLRRLEGELQSGTPSMPVPIPTAPAGASWGHSSASAGAHPRRDVPLPLEGGVGGNDDSTTRAREVPVSSASSKSSWFPSSTPPMRQTLFPSLGGIGGGGPTTLQPAPATMPHNPHGHRGGVTILDYSRLGLDPPSDSRTVSDGGLTDASPSPAMSKEPSFC